MVGEPKVSVDTKTGWTIFSHSSDWSVSLDLIKAATPAPDLLLSSNGKLVLQVLRLVRTTLRTQLRWLRDPS